MKPARVRRKKRRKGEEDTEQLPAKGPGFHWYIFSLSILLVTAFSFLNFLSLPDARAHSLLSAVLLKRRAAISGDPHSDPAFHGINDEERIALLKAAEEALQAPLPVVQADQGHEHAALRGGQKPFATSAPGPPAPPEKSAANMALQAVDSLRARSKAVFSAISIPLQLGSGGGIATFSGESWLQLDEAVDADELTFGAWIYVPQIPEMSFPLASESMKTIASTKVSGCSTTNKGWALFMHEWSTTNRQLRLSWTDSVSGCNEIYSESTLVPYDKWVMVGFSLSKARNRASIMLDKQLIVDTQLGLGKYSRQQQTMGIQQAGIDQRILSDSGKILFGAHIMPKATDIAMAHGFIGFMGDTPAHPMSNDAAAAALEIESVPGPTLPPEKLSATWPKEWLSRYGKEELMKSQTEADVWAAEVRGAMKHTWDGYRTKAWGHDEVQPNSGRPKDWCRMAVTMLDALSTLWVMGFRQEFEEAAQWLEDSNLPGPGSHGQNSLFEINIRAFAGLLSAYSLSGKRVFLDTARRLGEKLLSAFTSPSGLPLPTIDIGTGKAAMHSWNANTVLAEATTLQVEFRYMSKVTGDSRWQEAADKAMDVVLKAAGQRGLIPIYLSSPNKQAVSFVGSKMSMGAMGDSYYEYLLKLWIQGGKRDVQLKEAWKRAMKEMFDQMVSKTAGGLQFLAELEGGRKRNRMDHLACFVAGMLMLGSRSLPPEEVDARWEPFAADLTYTCYQMYVRTPTGLSPEYVNFNPGSGKGSDMSIPGDAPQNLLRPEAAEAVWYMWYYTGDHKYRQWGHDMFLPFLKYSKVKYGFSAISDVRKRTAPKRDSQESFWLGETLKYFYLIFAPRNTVNLEEFVLNTEAQPLKVFD
ncbi:unnamed protein product [Durusdinium trenchii]|uniref:alpha-1,2-Mannosidase n=1 Tax=Durusdinium trenchii TaxID=1381693 RepID=A0ABP0PKG5_9DINO